MIVNCISCGHKIDIGDSYNEYEGLIKCFTCGALLEIKTKDGNINSVKLVIPEAPNPDH